MKAFIKFLFIWHRHLGVFACIFVLLLSITGILLNHADSLELEKTPIHNPTILGLYGIPPQNPIHGLIVNQQVIAQSNHALFIGPQKLGDDTSPLVGALQRADQMWLIATEDTLYLLTADFQPIETLDTSYGLPIPIRGLAEHNGKILMQTDESKVIEFDLDTLQSTPSAEQSVDFPHPQSLDIAQVPAPIRAELQNSIPLERVLLDLHSGRLFGRLFVYLMDIAALCLIFLSLSGLTMWSYIKRAKKRAKR